MNVQLWLAYPETLRANGVLEKLLLVLDAHERQHYERFSVAERREEYLAAHALARFALSHDTDITPQSWKFSTNENGKPFVEYPAQAKNVFFSLSHTKHCVACVVAREIQVGVDVECLDRESNDQAIANRFFSQAEADDLASCLPHQRRERFVQMWTVKESVVKALGGTSAHLFRKFSVMSQNETVELRFDSDLQENSAHWWVKTQSASSHHRVAVAARGVRNDSVNLITRVWSGPT